MATDLVALTITLGWSGSKTDSSCKSGSAVMPVRFDIARCAVAMTFPCPAGRGWKPGCRPNPARSLIGRRTLPSAGASHRPPGRGAVGPGAREGRGRSALSGAALLGAAFSESTGAGDRRSPDSRTRPGVDAASSSRTRKKAGLEISSSSRRRYCPGRCGWTSAATSRHSIRFGEVSTIIPAAGGPEHSKTHALSPLCACGAEAAGDHGVRANP